MKIAIIGLGYVGLVTSACLAELGHQVLGIDIDSSKVKALKDGHIPIYEPGLRELVVKNSSEERLSFTDKFGPELDEALLIFLAVGTPSSEDETPDLTAVYKSIDSIVPLVKTNKIFVLKSTVPIGTNLELKKYLSKKLKTEFDIVSNPEFLKEGTAVQDFMKPDRIVVGAENIKSIEVMKDLYSHLVRNGHPILIMDPVSAETVKYASNFMLAVKVAFINELAEICDHIGADIRRVREGIISDPRIGSQFLYPSLGFGGSCLPKDVQALNHLVNKEKISVFIPQATLDANERHATWFINKIINSLGKDIQKKTLTIWGTAFKAGTDDIRESPALKIIEGLAQIGINLKIFDPIAQMNTQKYFSNAVFRDNLLFAKNESESIIGSNALVVCTEWLQFRNPDFERLSKELKDKIVFDGRNLYDPDKLKLYGLNHIGIGISNAKAQVTMSN